MSTERKIFWAFAWLALALIGAFQAVRQISVVVLIVPAAIHEMPAPANRPLRQSPSFSAEGMGMCGNDTVGIETCASASGGAHVFLIPDAGWRLHRRVTNPAGGDVADAACRSISNRN